MSPIELEKGSVSMRFAAFRHSLPSLSYIWTANNGLRKDEQVNAKRTLGQVSL